MIEASFPYPRILLAVGQNESLTNWCRDVIESTLMFQRTEKAGADAIRFEAPEIDGNRFKVKARHHGKPFMLTKPKWNGTIEGYYQEPAGFARFVSHVPSFSNTLYSLFQMMHAHAYQKQIPLKDVMLWRQRWTRSGWIVADVIDNKYRPAFGRETWD
jgi:hypothetical protein